MPPTNDEFIGLALSAQTEPPPAWADGSPVTAGDWRTVLALRDYHRGMRERKSEQQRKAQSRALALLRSILGPDQRAELARRRCLVLSLPSGNSYRFWPRTGQVERVTQHGSHWFIHTRYCVHDAQDDGAMPPADRSLAHLLMLLADETEFLATANATYARDQLWNPAYLRRMREQRSWVVAS